MTFSTATHSPITSPAPVAPAEPASQAALERNQLIDAAAKLIFELLGMKPPPGELITPENFGPMHAFVDQVQAIVAASRGPVAPTSAAGLPATPVISVDANGGLESRVSPEQVEAVLGPHVDRIRSAMARQEGTGRQFVGEGPLSALYAVRYLATTLAEAQMIAGDAMNAVRNRRNGPPATEAPLAEPLWNSKGNVIHAAVDRLGAAQRAAAAVEDSVAATPPGMAAPGTWVCDGGRVAKVRDVYPPTKHEPEGAYDLVIYARDGKRIGRESPAMGGPRGFEPFCSAANWRQIEEPKFPLDRYEYLKNIVKFKPGAGSSPEGTEGVEDALDEAPRP